MLRGSAFASVLRDFLLRRHPLRSASPKKEKVRVYFLLMKNCVDHLATRHGYTGMMTGCYRAYSTLIKFSLFRSSMAAAVDAITHNEYNISHNLNQIQSRISRFTAIASLSYLRHLGLLLCKIINH